MSAKLLLWEGERVEPSKSAMRRGVFLTALVNFAKLLDTLLWHWNFFPRGGDDIIDNGVCYIYESSVCSCGVFSGYIELASVSLQKENINSPSPL